MIDIQLVEVNKDQKDIYNQFVANSLTGSFLQSWEWGEWQEQLGRQVFRYWILDDSGPSTSSGTNGGQIVGALQLIKMPLAFGKYYLYAPYGPIINDEFQISNFKSISNEIISKFPKCVFIRIETKFLLPTTHYPLFIKSANIQPGKTLIIDLTKNEDQLLAEMHSKTRYNIRLAQKHGVEIKDEFEISVGNGLFAKEAVELIVETSKRQGYKGYGIDYYQKMINYFALQNRGDLKLHIYKAIYNKQLLASAIIIDFGKTRTFLFGGSRDSNKNIMAPYLMHWQAMVDAKAAGLLQYDFWGVETSKGDIPGFVRFKLGFAHPTDSTGSPQASSGSVSGIKEYAGAYDMIADNFQYKLYGIFRKIKRLL